VSRFDVPGSKRVEGVVQRHHIRYFSIPVEKRAVISKIALESYKNGVSPTVLAITASTDAPIPRQIYAAAPKPAPKPPEALPKSGETLPPEAQPGALRVLLIGGGSSHDFEQWFHQDDSATLKAAGKIVPAYTANLEEALALLPNADVVVISANQAPFGTPPFQQALQAFAAAGHGIVVLHPGVWYNWAPVSGYNARIVGGGARSHDALGPFTVTVAQPQHPIMRDVPATFEVTDELYQVVLEPTANCDVLATTSTSKRTNQQHPSVWTVPNPTARIACIALGHDGKVHDLPAFKTILVNAVRWVGGK
jgi:type 1 glutamine amidotransferase